MKNRTFHESQRRAPVWPVLPDVPRAEPAPGTPPERFMCDEPRRLAFTLIELMIVVVLIGVLTAMILPDMRGSFEDALLRSASRELVNVFSIASSRAVSLNQEHRVQLDPRTGRYQIERKAEPDELAPASYIPVKDLADNEGRIDPRITIELRMPEEDQSAEPVAESAQGDPSAPLAGADHIITFHPDGSADGVEILLQDRQGFRRLLRVNPTTARVQIIERQQSISTGKQSEEAGGSRHHHSLD